VKIIWAFLFDACDLTNIVMRQEENCNNYTGRVKGHVCRNLCTLDSLSYCCLQFFVLARQPPVGHSLLIHEVSRSHTTTHNSRQGSPGAGRRDLYLTTHNTHNRQTSMPPVGFESTISAGEQPQTYVLDRAATGAGFLCITIGVNN
jgi:hypothetical protein